VTPPPMRIEALGSFFVGGRTVTIEDEQPREVTMSRDVPGYRYDPNGTYAIDHAYVNYVIPADTDRPPVVFVHGGGMTGTCWETTPDGRPGWLTGFLRAGWPCYVIDNAERGRAGWCGLPGLRAEEPITRGVEECWTTFRIGREGDYPARKPFPGGRFPVDALPELARYQVPRWTTTDDLGVAGLLAAVEKIGRCVVIGHSQGGGFAAQVAEAAADKVIATVLLEPHGLPERATGPQLIVLGDNLEQSAVTTRLAPVWADYRARNANVDLMHLPALGQPGNSHLMMADSNSDAVSSLVQEWIEKKWTELAPVERA
jgi:pimeloyl-ACP methyl ester carboxylesterase